MRTYISLPRFTQEGIENIKKSPEWLNEGKKAFKAAELKQWY